MAPKMTIVSGIAISVSWSVRSATSPGGSGLVMPSGCQLGGPGVERVVETAAGV